MDARAKIESFAHLHTPLLRTGRKKRKRREGEERKEEWRDKEERRRWMVEGKRV